MITKTGLVPKESKHYTNSFSMTQVKKVASTNKAERFSYFRVNSRENYIFKGSFLFPNVI